MLRFRIQLNKVVAKYGCIYYFTSIILTLNKILRGVALISSLVTVVSIGVLSPKQLFKANNFFTNPSPLVFIEDFVILAP
ncbi:MAG: hypothetical protein DRP01_04555 [Archaeoglobales archaeon]|nr:MAG: hypothetical protein DRP01_04555 [Archaeoglobales archaeon]